MQADNFSRRNFLKFSAAATAAAFTPGAAAGDSAEPKPTIAQREWMKLGYGMFIHFGPNTIEGVGWGDGKFPPEKLVFPKLDVAQWAETAARAGMKYAVLTAKHVDGLCLWPSKFTEYSVKNSPAKKDIAALFVEEFRKAGLKTGFYYCLLDRNFPHFDNDELYNEYVRNQITELLTGYGPVIELWFDGAWVKDHPTGDWPFDPAWEKDPHSGLLHGQRWHWDKLYELIHRLQADCLVFNNSSSDRPGQIKYHPVDARTAEHFDFIYKGEICQPRIDPVFTKPDGREVFLPLQFEETITPGWFYKPDDYLMHPSVATICDWYQRARSANASLLLNVGPDNLGLIPDYNRHYLAAAAKRLGLD